MHSNRLLINLKHLRFLGTFLLHWKSKPVDVFLLTLILVFLKFYLLAHWDLRWPEAGKSLLVALLYCCLEGVAALSYFFYLFYRRSRRLFFFPYLLGLFLKGTFELRFWKLHL
jgi:hypothetical protein